MKRKRLRSSLMVMVIGIMLAGLVGAAHGSVAYTATNGGINDDGSENWLFEYLVTNTTPSVTLESFVVFFSPYASFTFPVTLPDKTGWDVIMQDALDFSGKFYVAGAQSGNGIAYGATEQGFIVPFVYFGYPGGATLPQSYTAYFSDATSENGITTTVPEPGTVILLALALPLVGGCRILLNRRTTVDGVTHTK